MKHGHTSEGENSAVSTTSKGRKQERLGRRGGYVLRSPARSGCGLFRRGGIL
jgi:hypothetical protein